MKTILLSLLVTFFLCTNIKGENNNLNAFQSSTSQKILIINDDPISPEEIAHDIYALGYTSDMTIPDMVTLDLLNQYDIVILSCGSNYYACRNTQMRVSLQAFIINGGKVIVEGGDNGYIADVYPIYSGFKNKVLKVLHWVNHSGGDLILNQTFHQTTLALYPNTLSDTLTINFKQNSDQDVCIKNEFSDLFYHTSQYPQYIGILVYPSASSPQLINLSFNYLALLNRQDALNLLENCLWNLIGEPVGISNNNKIIPSEFKLYQNYPNPFNPVTKISYEISTPLNFPFDKGGNGGFVSLKVYDVLGNEIATLVDEKKSAKGGPGIYNVEFDGSAYSSGVYFYSLSVDGIIIDRKKMILLK